MASHESRRFILPKKYDCFSKAYSGWQLTKQITLQWHHNGRDGVSKHQLHDCLLSRLFRRRSKKITKLRVTGLCGGIHRWPMNSPHKGPVTRKMFPFDDVIMRKLSIIGPMLGNHRSSVDSPYKGPATREALWCHCVTSNGSWCIGIKGEMSGTVCVTFTWDIYIYMSCL